MAVCVASSPGQTHPELGELTLFARDFDAAAVLLHHGLGRTLWNSLTVTGIVEARGQILADYAVPDFQAVIEEDLSETATGHLGEGLFLAKLEGPGRVWMQTMPFSRFADRVVEATINSRGESGSARWARTHR